MAVQILKFIIAIGLIVILVWRGQLDFSLLGHITAPQYAVPLILLTGLGLLLLNYRWQLLLNGRGLYATFQKTFPVYLIGVFFNYALPGSIGGDVIKAIYVAQDNPRGRIDAIATVLVDRILGLYAMILMSLSVILLNLKFVFSNSRMLGVSLMATGLFLAMSLFLGLALSRRMRELLRFDLVLKRLPLGDKISKAYLAIHAYRDHLPLLARSVFISVIGQLTTIVFMIIVGHAIGEGHISWETYLFAVPIGFIVTAVPLAPAGIGVGQMAFLFLFQLYSGEKTPLGQTAITAFQIALFMWGLVGAYFYLRRKRPEDLVEDQND